MTTKKWAIVAALTALLVRGAAAQVVDQQQPVIDTSVGGSVIGPQKLAQVVTAGISGTLVQVDLPVACSPGSDLVLEIHGVTAGSPNGTVLVSQVVLGATIPAAGPQFRTLTLSTPAAFSAGQSFAIVLQSSGSCGTFQGPAGDPYAGGNLYFDSPPNPPGWVCVCAFPGSAFDLPFRTFVVASTAAAVPTMSAWSIAALALTIVLSARIMTSRRRVNRR